MKHNRTTTKSGPYFLSTVAEPRFREDLVGWGTYMNPILDLLAEVLVGGPNSQKLLVGLSS
jgi:hypothetical protein